jgi:hypothetical protein
MTNDEQLQIVKRWRDAREEIKIVERQLEPLKEKHELLIKDFRIQVNEVAQLVSPDEPRKLFTLGDCAIILNYGEDLITEMPITGSVIPPVPISTSNGHKELDPNRVIHRRKRTRNDNPVNPIIVENWPAIMPLYDWMNERERIRIKKDAGEKAPWTDDPILREFSFCNVFREDDRVTRWIAKNFREPYKDHPNLWFALCASRQINWPPSLAAIGFPDGNILEWKERAIAILEKRQAEGHKIYTGAYMLRADPASPEQSKIRYTMDKVLMPVWNSTHEIANDPEKTPFKSIETTVDYLSQFYAYGNFLSYEIATDMRWTRYGDKWDVMTYANAGPGAVRGLNRLFGRDVKMMIPKKQALAEMQFLLANAPKYLGKHVKSLEIRDIESGLCEVDKWLRVKNGEGRPRAKFSVHGDRGYEI